MTPTPATSPADWAVHASRGKWLPARHLLYVLGLVVPMIVRGGARVIVTMPPRHGKSLTLSRFLPGWFLGMFPDKRVVVASHSGHLATGFGRAARRDFAEYAPSVFGLNVSPESHAADRWEIAGRNGGMRAVGIGGSLTGEGADLLLPDDYCSDAEAALSETQRQATWDWWESVASTRLEPGASVVCFACLTGGAPVAMAGGGWRRIDEVRPGDEVIGHSGGAAVARRVVGWKESGEDDILEVRTGNSTVRCNARHPFLVRRGDGSEDWVRAGDLERGDDVVALRTYTAARSSRLTTDDAWLLGMMFGDGWVTKRDGWNTDKARNKKYPRRGFVTCCALGVDEEQNERIVGAFDSRFNLRPKRTRFGYVRTDVASVGRWFEDRGLVGGAKTKRLPAWLYAEPVAVRRAFIDGLLCADGYAHKEKPHYHYLKLANEALVRDVRALAITSGMRSTNLSRSCRMAKAPHSREPAMAEAWTIALSDAPSQTDFDVSRVRSIRPVGRAKVYDLAVEGENFIADGLVVHNTRWHEDDLIGRLLEREPGEWTVIRLPALAEEGDPIGREPGEALWPERYSRDVLEATKRKRGSFWWSAMYQGSPVPEGGGIFKRPWWNDRRYTREREGAPLVFADETKVEHARLARFMVLDAAVSEKQTADYSALGCFGLQGGTDGRLVVLDFLRDRLGDTALIEAVAAMRKLWEVPVVWVEDAGQMILLIKALRRAGIPVQCYGRKEEHALRLPTGAGGDPKIPVFHAAAPFVEAGRLCLPRQASWLSDVESELAKVPYAAHDDAAEVVSVACLLAQAGLVGGGSLVLAQAGLDRAKDDDNRWGHPGAPDPGPEDEADSDPDPFVGLRGHARRF